MASSLKLCLIGLLGAAAVNAAPAIAPEADVLSPSLLAPRASCTFSGSSGAANAIKNKKSCSTITLNSVAVPAGTTLDLTGLNSGTTVRSSSSNFNIAYLIPSRLSSKESPLSATRNGKDL